MQEPISRDEFGPEYAINLFDPKTGMRGILVIHNTVLGPGKGGIRMTADVTTEEVGRLASTMTWKNALAGIPFGGAKAGLIIPHGTTPDEKKILVEAFARAIKPFIPKKYIGGPDVNSGEKEMGWIAKAIKDRSAVTGKPKVMGGIPHEVGSTGFGVAHSARIAAELAGIPIIGATVAIHGFGNVGTFAYRYLTEMGARVVAIADHTGAVHEPGGFDNAQIEAIIKKRGTMTHYKGGKPLQGDAFWGVPVDILIPASVTDVIHKGNMNKIKAKIIVEAGNIPMREPIEQALWKKGIMIVPDFVANAGGVISSYAETKGFSDAKMFKLVKEKITSSTTRVMQRSLKEKRYPREVALAIAQELVAQKMKKTK